MQVPYRLELSICQKCRGINIGKCGLAFEEIGGVIGNVEAELIRPILVSHILLFCCIHDQVL